MSIRPDSSDAAEPWTKPPAETIRTPLGDDGKPLWCRECDQVTRLIETPDEKVKRCPTCHPLT